MLNKLFGAGTPERQHEARRKALLELPAASAELLAIATSAEEPVELRLLAISRSEQRDALAQLHHSDPDEQIKSACASRLCALLVALPQDDAASAPTAAALAQISIPAVIREVALTAPAMELRLAAIDQLQCDETLSQIATRDAAFKVRAAAIEKISARDQLQQLLETLRKQDKRTARIAKQRLQAFKSADDEAARRRERQTILCTQAEELDASNSNLLRRIEQISYEWQACAPAEEDLQPRFDAAIARARQLVEAPAEDEQTLVPERYRELVTIRRQLESGEAEADVDATRARLRELDREWHASNPEEQWREAFVRDYEACESVLRSAAIATQQAHQRDQLVADLQAKLEAETLPSGHQLKQFDARLRQLDEPLAEPAALLLTKLRQRLADSRAQQLATAKRLQQDIDQLDQHLQAGEFAEALAIYQRLHHLEQARGALPPAEQQQLHRQLAKYAPQIHELSEWRHWANEQERRVLCQKVGALIAAEMSPPELAREVRAVRQTWRDLDKAEGTAGKAWWDRFNELCNRAYAPCAEYFEQQANERSKNLELRESVCTRLEAIAAETDWESVEDWHQIYERIKKQYRKWQQAGPVDRKAHKAIEKRYQAVCKQLDAHLDVERQRNRVERESLIERAAQLAEASDQRNISRSLRELRDAWQTTVPSGRRTEQALWKRFRAACDQVHARQNESRAQHLSSLQENLATREALCQQLNALAVGSDSDLGAMRKQLEALQRDWRAVGPAPKKQQQQIEQRFRDAWQGVQAALSSEALRRKSAVLDSYREAATLCGELEQAVIAASDVSALAARWHAVKLPSDALATALAKRAEHALGTAAAGTTFDTSELNANRTRLEEICLLAEVAASIESPAEFAAARMTLQVSRLADAMQGETQERYRGRSAADNFWHDWLSVGPVATSELRSGLEQRFNRAIQALEKTD